MSLIAEPVIPNANFSGMLVVLQELRAGCAAQKAKAITKGTNIKQ
jgi:hypothetical protein